jgi:hypothetical protein
MSMVEHCILAEKTLGKVCPKFVPFETAHDDFLKDCGTRLRPLPNLDVPPHITERLLNHIDGEISDVAAIYNRSRAAWNCWIRSFGSFAGSAHFGHLFVTPRQGSPIGVVGLASGLEAGLLLISERPVPVSG